MKKEKELYNVLDIARYIINYSRDKKHPVSNLKLQKLLYYVQANFLVKKNKPCFAEDIIHWDYGPIVREVYDEFKGFGREELPYQKTYGTIEFDTTIENIKYYDKEFDDKIINEEDKNLINQVITSYFRYSPFEMVNKTHSEQPWKVTSQNEIMNAEVIEEYYRTNTTQLMGNIQ